MKKEPNREPIFHEVGSFTSNELPHLVVKRTKGTTEFTMDEWELHSKGWTHEEAKEGMVFLLEKIKRLP